LSIVDQVDFDKVVNRAKETILQRDPKKFELALKKLEKDNKALLKTCKLYDVDAAADAEASSLAEVAMKQGWETYYEGKLAMALTDKGLLSSEKDMRAQVGALVKSMFSMRVATKNLAPALWTKAKTFV